MSMIRDLVFVVRQFLEENHFPETLHKLEQEAGIFKLDYFEKKCMAGDWDEVEKYLFGFTTKMDVKYSALCEKMRYRIRRQKYLEALDSHDKVKAIDLLKDLVVCLHCDNGKLKELMDLLILDNFRECTKFSKYGDTIHFVRETTMRKLKRQIERNPSFQVHLECPTLSPSRLETLISQSLKWQLRKCPSPKSDTVALFTDHTCSPNCTPSMESSEVVALLKCYTIVSQNESIANEVVRLFYTKSGDGLLAHGTRGTLKLLQWSTNEQNLRAPDDSSVHLNGDPSRPAVPYVAFWNSGPFFLLGCGGQISKYSYKLLPMPSLSLFAMDSMQCLATVTSLVFYPDKNIIGVGLEDSIIQIFNYGMNTLKCTLKGHQKRITGLCFSTTLGILVSSSANAKLCFWKIDSWKLEKSLLIQMPEGKEPDGSIEVQFHSDEVHLLVRHWSHLAIYDASTMNLIQQWLPPKALLSGFITSATYSCNNQLVYASFTDGNIAVLDAPNFRLRCRITSSAYLPRCRKHAFPLTIAAHPKNPNQLAFGLSNGSGLIIEP